MKKLSLIPIILVFVWMIVIFLFSQEPSEESSARSGAIVHTVISTVGAGLPEELVMFITRKAAHTFLYFVLGALLLNIVRHYPLQTRGMLAISVLCAFCYATTDELHQTFVPGRSGEVRDVAIDTTAATLGAGSALILTRRMNGKNSKNNI